MQAVWTNWEEPLSDSCTCYQDFFKRDQYAASSQSFSPCEQKRVNGQWDEEVLPPVWAECTQCGTQFRLAIKNMQVTTCYVCLNRGPVWMFYVFSDIQLYRAEGSAFLSRSPRFAVPEDLELIEISLVGESAPLNAVGNDLLAWLRVHGVTEQQAL